MNTKQIKLDGVEDVSLMWKIRMFLYEHNPIPYSVRYWFDKQTIFHPVRIYHKVQNILRWIPILWDDVDWDYSSLYKIMEFKIRKMAEHHREHDYHVGTEEIVDQMVQSADALKRIHDDNYVTGEYEAVRTKFPERSFEDLPGKPGWKRRPAPSVEESAALDEVFNLEEARRKADYDLFTTLFRESRGWWC